MTDASERIAKAIAQLTTDECDSVTIFAANPEFNGPNNAIECYGLWTDLIELRFVGDYLLDCLEKAVSWRDKKGAR